MESMLPQKSQMNVGKNERLASLMSGGGLVLLALVRSSKARLPLALSGGYLLYRGVTGKDPVYQALGIQRESKDGQSGIRVTGMVTINRPRDEVYAFWRNFENFPRFMKHVETVQVRGDGNGSNLSHWVARAPLDRTVEWDAEITDERENELIAWRSLPGAMVENYGRVEFKDSRDGRGTEVYVTLTYDPPAGSASAALARLFGEEPHQQIREDLRRFKQVMETGEVPTVKGQPSGRISQVEQEREQIKHVRRFSWEPGITPAA